MTLIAVFLPEGVMFRRTGIPRVWRVVILDARELGGMLHRVVRKRLRVIGRFQWMELDNRDAPCRFRQPHAAIRISYGTRALQKILKLLFTEEDQAVPVRTLQIRGLVSVATTFHVKGEEDERLVPLVLGTQSLSTGAMYPKLLCVVR